MKREAKPRSRRWLAVCAVAALLALGIWLTVRAVSADLLEQGAAALEQSVRQAAVQCYAIEGSYPPSLSYLEQNYGLQINHARYYVSYSAFASNRMPDITVLQKP